MIDEQQIRSVALFFLYSLIDERAALQASDRVIADLKTTLASVDGEVQARQTLMKACVAQYWRSRKHVPRGRLNLDFKIGWNLPAHTEISPWARFQKETTDEELIALLFSRVLGIADSEIADALGVTEGTIRYRVGKAVRQLGAANRLTV